MSQLENLTTEARNPASEQIDSLSALEIVRLISAQDAGVAEAVAREAEAIAQAIEAIAARLRSGGRLIYLGAGTSGRLGVLDAAECPPTFNTPPGQVIGLIAGGPAALVRAVEGAEDQPHLAVEDLKAIGLGPQDVVVGIATSGRTPYVLGGLQYASQQGALCVGLSCNPDPLLARLVQIRITPVVGPEVISGSTRMKAGTATKMVLNMLSTGAMVLLGKTYGNLMVDLQATNSKLRDRACRIVMALTGLSEAEARAELDRSSGELKTAIVAQLCSVTPQESRRLLEQSGGHLRRAIEQHRKKAEAAQSASAPVRHAHAAPELAEQFVLGIDGGGTKTTAWLAHAAKSAGQAACGVGTAGPSNPHSIGFDEAIKNLDRAVDAAFSSAKIAPGTVSAAVLALAGSDRNENRQLLNCWAANRRLARRFSLVSDVLPVLTAGTPAGWGVALIAGTGSFCYARTPDGRTAKAGGWGYLLGDEGSAYGMALAGLRSAVRAVDGRDPPTRLLDAFLDHLGLQHADQLVDAVHCRAKDRSAIAALARVVMDTAEAGDQAAQQVVAQAAEALAAMVLAVVRGLDLEPGRFPLALAGGPLVHRPGFRQLVISRLEKLALHPQPVALVPEPAAGAVAMARAAAQDA